MMNRIPYLIFLWTILLAIGCSSSREIYSPQKKYARKDLQQDYKLFRNILEESHPSLYWFTPKDSMAYFFDQGYNQIADSMSEPEFKNILSVVVNKIHCGHTSVKNSKKYIRYLDTARLRIFPLSFKVWGDTIAVTGNLNRYDSVLRRGTIVTSIDGRPARQLVDTFINYLSGDGLNVSSKYQMMSNRGTFGTLYRNVVGLKDSFTVHYLDMYGEEKETIIPVFTPPPPDTTSRKDSIETLTRAQRDRQQERVLNGARYVQIDTSLSSAYMVVNTFARGNRLRPFFRKAFRVMRNRNIQHLVVDVRSNGGGDADISTKLTRYLADKKFKLADSLYAVRRSSHYGKYMQWQPMYWTFMQFVTKKRKDGFYHFGYFERHYFSPIKRHHFDGDIYIITGGNSFSATTLFAKVLQGQHNVKIIGEETGGGAYGNSAWMIPDVTLPTTRIRFRLPKFRLVMDEALVKEGRGVIPDIEAAPTLESVRRGIDPKVEMVRKLILQKSGIVHQ
jgi:Peptidase family S41